jgi:hypothetical protein
MPTRTIQVLLHGIIDYAGLYPPAKLEMGPAVDNYANYLRDPQAWMLGRFICAVSRLEEFRREAKGTLPHEAPPGGEAGENGKKPSDVPPWEEPWRISAIIDGDLDENLDAIFAFNHEHEQPKNGLANIDAIEIKVPGGEKGAEFIDASLDIIPEEVYPFFEIPLTGTGGEPGDVRGLVASLAGSDAAAKVRTGGVTADAFPPPEAVAAFLAAAAAADVPFKATAGLHHPLRGDYPLTYEPGCPRTIMHGFLNVFLAAALIRQDVGADDAALEMLRETTPGSFKFTDDGAAWRTWRFEVEHLARVRESFAMSYGSCSFEEPVEELKGLGLL